MFYNLPKVHKGLVPLKGRFIVSGISGLTQNVGTYLDKVLRGFVVSLPTYIRDTTDLLVKLEGIYVESMMLASIDVEALYSSIPHKASPEATQYYLEMRCTQFHLHSEFVLRLLTLYWN